jgi:hypothetical protein
MTLQLSASGPEKNTRNRNGIKGTHNKSLAMEFSRLLNSCLECLLKRETVKDSLAGMHATSSFVNVNKMQEKNCTFRIILIVPNVC